MDWMFRLVYCCNIELLLAIMLVVGEYCLVITWVIVLL